MEFAIVDKINIDNNKQKKYSRPYSSAIQSQSTKCVDHIYKFAGNKNVMCWHSDDSSGPYGSISANPEPKTDIILKIGSTVYKTSVKMAGPVQLASGQGESSAILFESAAKMTSNANKSKVLKSIITELKTMPTKLLSEQNKKRILTESNPKIINEFIKGGKIIKDKSYELWMQSNKEILMKSMLEYMDKDPEFFNALLYESLTGESSLAKYRGASADRIISPNGFYKINAAYVASIKSKVKFDIRGKSRGGISSIAFRIDLRG